ncbi:MAG: putative sugar nucleotidyl transferase [Chitinophagaceae bacterium]
MNLIDDDAVKEQLFPFTLTRSIADIRIGILTIREKWLLQPGPADLNLPSNLLPSKQVAESLKSGNNLFSGGHKFIKYPWHIFQYNDWAIRQDFTLITTGRTSQPIPLSNAVICPEHVFLEEGARVEHSSLNASTGPIYIGKYAEVMEGSLIRGPFALCEGGVIKMGARIYGATTIGPYSVGGGEIKNSVILGYSNKAHDGYLGDSVIGEWCNLGAGTSNSNLKNNAGEIRLTDRLTGQSVSAGIKCGLLMGDYSRCAINTSFNTGTIAGVCCNIFSDGLTPTYIPHFSWGAGLARYDFDKALLDINKWKNLKNHSLTGEEVDKLRHIFDNH